MRKSLYRSCRCKFCRAASSKRKGEIKRETHRRLRRLERLANREGRVPPESISGDYAS